MPLRLEGIIAAIPTAFHSDETLHLDALESNLQRWNDTSLAGYTVLGTTGEFVALTLDEKKKVLSRAREAATPEKVFLAGTGAESTHETLALTRWLGTVGADYAIVVTPQPSTFWAARGKVMSRARNGVASLMSTQAGIEN